MTLSCSYRILFTIFFFISSTNKKKINSFFAHLTNYLILNYCRLEKQLQLWIASRTSQNTQDPIENVSMSPERAKESPEGRIYQINRDMWLDISTKTPTTRPIEALTAKPGWPQIEPRVTGMCSWDPQSYLPGSHSDHSGRKRRSPEKNMHRKKWTQTCLSSRIIFLFFDKCDDFLAF